MIRVPTVMPEMKKAARGLPGRLLVELSNSSRLAAPDLDEQVVAAAKRADLVMGRNCGPQRRAGGLANGQHDLGKVNSGVGSVKLFLAPGYWHL
jgi:hypothetical protein